MTDHRSRPTDAPACDLSLTPDEYRLIADLLLEHLETHNLRDERLEGLVNRLYVLAVRTTHPDAERLLQSPSARTSPQPSTDWPAARLRGR